MRIAGDIFDEYIFKSNLPFGQSHILTAGCDQFIKWIFLIDRHEHIGQGTLGLNPFRFILNDPRFTSVPKILETPKGDNDEMDAVNLGVLRGLIG